MWILFLFLLLLLVFLYSAIFFPLPLNDGQQTRRYRTLPWMTYTLVTINIGVHLFWQLLPWKDYYEKIWLYGYRQSYMQEGLSIGAFVSFTSMFMHANIFHLLGNMIYLRVFGRRVEDACGPWRFLAFYLLCGMMAHLGQVNFNPLSASADIPSIGASGAISGVMGAYLLLFYSKQITCLWGIGSALRVPAIFLRNMLNHTRHPLWQLHLHIPAFWLLIAFLVMNTIPSFEIIQNGRTLGGVGYLAHFVGFLAGMTVFLFVRKDLLMRYVMGRAL